MCEKTKIRFIIHSHGRFHNEGRDRASFLMCINSAYTSRQGRNPSGISRIEQARILLFQQIDQCLFRHVSRRMIGRKRGDGQVFYLELLPYVDRRD